MVSTGVDAQAGMSDEPIADREVQDAVKDWFAKSQLCSGARRTIKDSDGAKKKVRDLMPGFDDGVGHRFTFIDETTPEPVRYVVNVRPGPEPAEIQFERKSQARMKVEQVEAPRD